MKLGTLFGVSIGSGDPKYLTVRAVEVLREASVIFTVISQNATNSVSLEVVNSVQPQGDVRVQVFSMSRDATVRFAKVQENVAEIVACLQQGQDCAFATLGDALTYSTFGYVLKSIKEILPDVQVEIVPGITSFATLAAKSGQVLVENKEMLRVIPSFSSDAAEQLTFPENSTTILLKTYHSRDALIERLRQEEHIEVIYGEYLGMENEAILHDLEQIQNRTDTYLSLMMVKKKSCK